MTWSHTKCVFRAILRDALRNKNSAEKRQVFAIEALPGSGITKEEALAGLNEMVRMGCKCSTDLYAEMLMAANKEKKFHQSQLYLDVRPSSKIIWQKEYLH